LWNNCRLRPQPSKATWISQFGQRTLGGFHWWSYQQYETTQDLGSSSRTQKGLQPIKPWCSPHPIGNFQENSNRITKPEQSDSATYQIHQVKPRPAQDNEINRSNKRTGVEKVWTGRRKERQSKMYVPRPSQQGDVPRLSSISNQPMNFLFRKSTTPNDRKLYFNQMFIYVIFVTTRNNYYLFIIIFKKCLLKKFLWYQPDTWIGV